MSLEKIVEEFVSTVRRARDIVINNYIPMPAVDKKTPNSNHPGWKQIAPYALIALVSFICGAALLGVMLWNAERLVALGLSGNLYYIVLLPLGLCAAVFLFGVLRSYASYSGKYLGGVLELGGPVVLFLLVVVLGFKLVPNMETFPVTVYVHGQRGPDDLVLRNSGFVVMDLGPDRRRQQIGDNGQAYFPAIPSNFRGQPVRVWLDSEQYESVGADQKRPLDSASLYLQVRKRSGRLTGHVQDQEGNGVAGAEVAVESLSARTNSSGYFELTIPGERLRDKLDLAVSAPGYSSKNYEVTPDANAIVIALDRR